MNRIILASFVILASSAPAVTLTAADVLILNGAGGGSVVAPDLQAAGFGVIQDAFNPGVIAHDLAADPNIVEVWVWNDPSYGQTGVPADPSRAFNAADQAALTAFGASHPAWIMDGLSWRGNDTDEANLTINEGARTSRQPVEALSPRRRRWERWRHRQHAISQSSCWLVQLQPVHRSLLYAAVHPADG